MQGNSKLHSGSFLIVAQFAATVSNYETPDEELE
jgi:hypothetical protein